MRIRTDKKTGGVVEVVEKVRLGDLNIYSPLRRFDWRLSISTEKPGESRLPFSPVDVELNVCLGCAVGLASRDGTDRRPGHICARERSTVVFSSSGPGGFNPSDHSGLFLGFFAL